MIFRAAGTLVLAENTSRVLLLQREDGQGWDQPGGAVDPGELDPAETATRELEEETGFSPFLLDCFDSFVVRLLPDGRYASGPEGRGVRAKLEYTIFLCTFREEFCPRLSAEHVRWGWFDLRDIPADVHPGTRVALDVLQRREDL